MIGDLPFLSVRFFKPKKIVLQCFTIKIKFAECNLQQINDLRDFLLPLFKNGKCGNKLATETGHFLVNFQPVQHTKPKFRNHLPNSEIPL